MLDELIFFMLMAVGVTYLDDGGPYASNYGCPAYCAVNHKHVAFKDTLVVISDMAKNNNKSMLGGFFNYLSGRLGTEIDSIPTPAPSFDNLKTMQKNVDDHAEMLLAKSAAVRDMENAGMDVDIIPNSDMAFKQAEPDNTKVDILVDDVTKNIFKPMDMADVWGATYQSESDSDKMALFREHQANFADPTQSKALQSISNVSDIAGDVFDGDEGISGSKLADLLYATGIHESGGGQWNRQKGGGPALGYFQVEPKTAKDLIKNSSAYFGPKAKSHFKSILGKDVNLSNISDKDLESLLMSDLGSAIFAGAKYLAGAKTKGSAYLDYLK